MSILDWTDHLTMQDEIVHYTTSNDILSHRCTAMQETLERILRRAQKGIDADSKLSYLMALDAIITQVVKVNCAYSQEWPFEKITDSDFDDEAQDELFKGDSR